MAVQTLFPTRSRSPAPSSASHGSHDSGSSSSIRSFDMHRLKHAAVSRACPFLLDLLRSCINQSSFLHQRCASSQISQRRHINSLNPACSLPEDVLRKIFIACARTFGNDDAAWSWVNVTYVCSSWRQVALDCQDLWRYVDFSHPKWFAITLPRAKTVPLCIRARVGPHNTGLLQRTLQLAHRIQSINLTCPIQHIHGLLPTLTYPNPALESLTIDVHIPNYEDTHRVYEPLLFPTTGAPLQRLRYLELRCAPFYMISPRFTFLTHLRLYDLPPCERPTRRRFLFMLAKIPLLQDLVLERAFPINVESDDFAHMEKRVTLSHLVSVSLTGSVTDLSVVLNCITMPPTVCLSCVICTLSDLKGNLWRLGQAIGAHSWAGADGVRLETLVITGREESERFLPGVDVNPDFRQSLRLRAYRADSEVGRPAFDLSIGPEQGFSGDDVMVTTLGAIWKALTLTHVHTMALQNLDIVTQKSWSQFLRTLPSLRVLDIRGLPPSGLVWTLLLNARTRSRGDVGNRDAQRLLIPRLNDIYIHGVDCSAGGFMVAPGALVNSHCDLDDSRFLDVLSACLSERRRYGLCLRSLSIARCEYVYKQSAEDAKKAVAHLVWDLTGIVKQETVTDETSPARYRKDWTISSFRPRHYHRLRTLRELDLEQEQESS